MQLLISIYNHFPPKVHILLFLELAQQVIVFIVVLLTLSLHFLLLVALNSLQLPLFQAPILIAPITILLDLHLVFFLLSVLLYQALHSMSIQMKQVLGSTLGVYFTFYSSNVVLALENIPQTYSKSSLVDVAKSYT